LDRFAARLSYYVGLLIGFDAAEVDPGWRLPVIGGVKLISAVRVE
jgi:hypothetical protein